MDALNPIAIGVDVGQITDPTAIVTAEISFTWRGLTRPVMHKHTLYTNRGPWHRDEEVSEQVLEPDYTIRHLERLPLGTNYLAVAQRVAEILCAEQMRGRERSVLVDVTGVGRPVFEMISAEVQNRPEARATSIMPITFTSGDRYDRSTGSLGKAYMVSRLQALLQRGAIHAPDTPEVRAMLEELKVYEIRVDQDAHFSAGAFKVGKHDDLATALGLACLEESGLEPLDAELVAAIQNFRGY